MYVICWWSEKKSDWATAENLDEAREYFLDALKETIRDNVHVFTGANHLTIEEASDLFSLPK